jgi:hypothetical protein
MNLKQMRASPAKAIVQAVGFQDNEKIFLLLLLLTSWQYDEKEVTL